MGGRHRPSAHPATPASTADDHCQSAAPPRPRADERLARVGFVARLFTRPDIGAFVGAVAVFFLFAITARQRQLGRRLRHLEQLAEHVRARTGSSPCPVALLMIGGEFDLSAGVMIGSSGLLLGILDDAGGLEHLAVDRGRARCSASAIGFINGFTVVKTKLPSFIVTLGTFFILRRAQRRRARSSSPAASAINNIDAAPGFDSAHTLFASIVWPPYAFKVDGALVARPHGRSGPGCSRGRASATGSTAPAATRWQRATSASRSRARRSALHDDLDDRGAAGASSTRRRAARRCRANEGVGREFIFIIAAVVGGCLLTGGYGSVIGDRVRRRDPRHGAASGSSPRSWDIELGVLRSRASILLARGDAQHGDPRRAERDDERGDERGGKPHLLEVEHVSKYFGNVVALQGRLRPRQRRRGDVHPRRQRRRQVDASSRSSRACTSTTRVGCSSTARRCSSPRRATRARSGIATVYQDLAMVPLMSIWRNFFLGEEPTKGRGPVPPLRHRAARRRSRASRSARDGHRHPRSGPGRRDALGRRAAGRRDRPRDLLRRTRADPRRADLRARRQAGGRRPPLHRAGGASAASA